MNPGQDAHVHVAPRRLIGAVGRGGLDRFGRQTEPPLGGLAVLVPDAGFDAGGGIRREGGV
ncbi:MAG: hypothetical protein H8F28_20455 [Fibrella sp.]|nr:hypothetical protein [Armatimonadota bacterium]